MSSESKLKLHNYQVQDVVSKYQHLPVNSLGGPTETPTVSDKQYRRSMQRSKTRSLSRDDREETFFESHLMPFLLDRIVKQMIEEGVDAAANMRRRPRRAIPVQWNQPY